MCGEVIYERGRALYLNITNRCTNECRFCIRNFSRGVFGYDLMLSKEPTFEEIVCALEPKLGKYYEFVFTGLGEPTIRIDEVLRITRYLHENGERVRLDTNGHGELVHGRDIVSMLIDAGLDAVSISLNAERKDKYDWLCRPKFENAYETILNFAGRCARKIETQLTAVSIEGIDFGKCEKISRDLGATFRIREYFGPEISIPDYLR